MTRALILAGADAVFDGRRLHAGAAVTIAGGRVVRLGPFEADAGARVVQLDGGLLAPGLIDVQVNGGGGAMLGDSASVDGIAEICAVHARLGATGILPTLITDTPEVMRAAIEAGIAAAQADAPGFLGLHLEGPHLDPRRKGAHDAGLIRPMTDDDLALYLRAARDLPALMITLAPEAASADQIAALAHAGVIVSLGHSDCTYAEARAAFDAGARAATHLFNAMRPMGHREPGLAGAVLDGGGFAGLIADGVHVAPPVLRIALAAKGAGVFIVSDSMAVAGTDATTFRLGGRDIQRRDGRLTLADGTLAGADCDLPQGLRTLIAAGIAQDRALAMATSVPAACIGLADRGHLRPGARAHLVHFDAGLHLRQVWQDGVALNG
jgi:N-acetylglucosamine-6-phosphate deacetylase